MTENLRKQINRIFDALSPAILGKAKANESVNETELQESWQILNEAAAREDLAFFQQLIDEDRMQLANTSKARDKFHLSALMAAAFAGQTEVVRMLLAAGADQHYKVEYFLSEFDALSLAVNKGHYAIARLLVEAGADPNALNPLSRPLTKAVKDGNAETARFLMELGADPGARGLLSNNTLLIEAADKGRTEIVRLLLEFGVDIHADNNFQETALDLACATGGVEIVRMLVTAGADVDRPGRDRVPPLVMAAASPNRLRFLEKQGFVNEGDTLEDIDDRAAQILQILLAADADPDAKSGNGSTALLITADRGSTEMVELLLAADADVNLSNERDKNANTPLIAAIENQHSEVAQLLLNAGADPLKPSGNAIAPIDLANSKGLSEVVELLKARGAKLAENATITALIGAARNGNLARVRAAIADRAVLDADDRGFPQGGLTALMYAAREGHCDIVEDLIAAGANLDRPDNRQLPWHRTALMYAAESDRPEIVRLLLQAGANPDASDRGDRPGRTALIYAAIEENVEVVRALLDGGASATLKDRQGDTALHCACEKAIVEMLLAAGADPYETGEDDSAIVSASIQEHGEIVQLMLEVEPADPEQAQRAKTSALDWAASHGDIDSIQKLMDAGVNINARAQGDEGSIPLITAVIHGHFETVKFLVNAGADLTVLQEEEEDGKNALSLAIERGYPDIACWLREAGATLPKNADEGYLMVTAARRQDEEAVQMLLDLGVDVNACDRNGYTLLSMAALSDLPEIVEIAIAAGADLEKYGASVLEQAIKDDFPAIVALLEEAGVQRT
ncbi:MAG: ankyrin repeat domain-containing protein [Cyanobacteria bacterium P01_E01_bin.42]